MFVEITSQDVKSMKNSVSKVTEILAPYTNGCSFMVQQLGFKTFCLRAEQTEIKGKPSIVIYQDFFTVEKILDDTWKIKERDGKFICKKLFNETITITPIDPETNIAPSVEWIEKEGDCNLVNNALHEQGIVRKILGITYYPLDLFRFRDRKVVLNSPQISSIIEVLGISKKRFTKTLYYYINEGWLYIGVWDYVRRLPLDPVRFKKMS